MHNGEMSGRFSAPGPPQRGWGGGSFRSIDWLRARSVRSQVRERARVQPPRGLMQNIPDPVAIFKSSAGLICGRPLRSGALSC